MLVTERRIRNMVDRAGYCVVDFASYDAFRETVGELGDTINITHIRVDHTRRAMLNSSLHMPFHTDHPSARYIAWYCAEPADEGGNSLLLDCRDVIAALTPPEVEAMKQLEVKIPPLAPGHEPGSRPILTDDGIYYADWLLQSSGSNRTDRLVKRLQAALRQIEPIRILLRRNQALVIDNHRMLHGRDAFADMTSHRCLVRHWIGLGARAVMESAQDGGVQR